MFFVYVLGVLAEGELHGRGRAHHHLIHDRPGGLEQDGLSGDGVCGAGPGEHAGHPRPAGLRKVGVEGIHTVQRMEVGGTGDRALVQVVLGGGATVQPQMAVGVEEAGEDVASLGIDEVGEVGVVGQAVHGPGLGDAAAFDQHEAVRDRARLHSMDRTVYDEHEVVPPLWWKIRPGPGFDRFFPSFVVHCTRGTGRGMGLSHAVIPFSRANRPLGSFPSTEKSRFFAV